jgi:hypothetical protein
MIEIEPSASVSEARRMGLRSMVVEMEPRGVQAFLPTTNLCCYLGRVIRKLLIIGVVLLLILLIFPMGISLAMGGCPECPTAGIPMLISACAILVATVLIFALAIMSGVISEVARSPGFIVVRRLERPPRSS